MAKVFLALSILFMIGAAGLGFVAKSKIEQKVGELKTTTARAEQLDHQLVTAKKDLKTSKDDLAAANKTVEDQKGQLTEAEGKVAAAKTEAEKANGELAAKDAELERVKKELADKPATPAGTGTPDPQIAILEQQVADANKALAESKVMQTQFQNRQKAAEENFVLAQKRIEHYEKQSQAAGLTGSVVAVNQGWNFVVLNLGDKQGVTVNSPLLVMRGGQRVATLKITSVEPRTSIADVVPGTLARGSTIQPGDRVVFAGGRGNAPPTPLPPLNTTSPESSPAASAPAGGVPQ